MPPPQPTPPATPEGRPTCAVCRQPLVRCVCAVLPRVATRTRVVIVQHPRERHHPFGTAALAARALTRAELVIAWRRDQALPLPDPAGRTWLLFPGPGSIPIDAALATGRPDTLVAVDGTWHTAPSLLARHGALAALPRVHLAPTCPGRYRIRAEPAPHCLSTLESLVSALTAIEPETEGLGALLAAFDAMVEGQLALLGERMGSGVRRRARPRPDRAVPRELVEDLERCLCVYGESAAAPDARAAVAALGRRAGAAPVTLQWVAVRPATGEHFERLVGPAHAAPEDWHLAHLGLTRAELAPGVAPAELARDFAAFAGRDAVLFAWNQSTIDLAHGLRAATGERAFTVAPPLKAIAAGVTHRRPGTLEALVATLGLPVHPAPVHGRAAERIARCVAVARWLHARRAAP